MKCLSRLLLLVVLSGFIFAAGCGTQATNAKEPMAFIEKVENGDAFVKHLGDKDFSKAESKTSLFEGSIVKTAAGAEAVIRFSTGAVTRVLSETEFELKERKVASTGQGIVYTRLVKGVAAFYVPKDAEAAKKFEVETERAVASIKGTTFKVFHDAASTTLAVAEGVVAFSAKTDGKSIDVEAYNQVNCGAAGLGGKEKFNVLLDPHLSGAGADQILKGSR
ncbi:MAG: FecR family protein [Candidatus Ozemobacteraceae bacterium]